MMNKGNTVHIQDDLSIYSDMHKDLYGMRPSEANWYRVNRLTPEQLEAELADMSKSIATQIDNEHNIELANAQQLKTAAETLASEQSVDIGTAYRWLMQAEGCCDADDIEHFIWMSGIGCGCTAFELVKQIREVL
jgi:hypothetical protein